MILRQQLQARQALVDTLPITGEMLRGSLVERTIRHRSGCPKCARGEGHRVFVLTVTDPGDRTRQVSVRRERVGEVRRWLANYQALKTAIEAICALNHDLRMRRPTTTPSARAIATMGRWGLALGPEVLDAIHTRIVDTTVAKAPIGAEAVLKIDALFAIERAINGRPPAERLAIRQATLRPLVDAIEVWLIAQRAKLSPIPPLRWGDSTGS